MIGYTLSPAERPVISGAPYLPAISTALKLRYGAVGLALAATSTFGNGLAIANLQPLAGAYGLDAADPAWLVAAFVGVGASANIFMIKGRQQFGLEPLLYGSLALYIVAAVADAAFPCFATALASRALNGLSTSTVVATGVYYLLQALDGKAKILSVPLSIAFAQIGIPLARLVPVEPLVADGALGLHLAVLAAVLLQFLLVWSNRLPPTYTERTFERLDLVTTVLLVPALVMLAGFLALGRALWWSDTVWLGEMGVAAAALITVALVIEAHRRRPLVDIAWLTRRDIGLFMLIALVERVVLAEQTTGSVGLLTGAGLDNDQLHSLYGWVIAAMLGGIAVMVVTLRERTVPFQILLALGAIMAGALVDTGSDAQTGPREMILSQCLIGFGTTLFVGPALLFFVGRFLLRGPEAYIPTILLFGAIQNLGSVAGTALIGTIQYHAQEQALRGLEAGLRVTSPVLSTFASEQTALIADAYRQASVIGYLDSFWVVAVLAGAAATAVGCSIAVAGLTSRAPRVGEGR